jgi:hypothetical protein
LLAEAEARGAERERARLTDLCEHLRHCRECGDMDVSYCDGGTPLWNEAFPDNPVEYKR